MSELKTSRELPGPTSSVKLTANHAFSQYEPSSLPPYSAELAHTRSSCALNSLTSGLLSTYKKVNPSLRYQPSFNPRRCLTQPSEPAGNAGHDNSRGDYILFVNEIIGDQKGHQYKVIDVLGCGTFGQVVKCQQFAENDDLESGVATGKLCAVKVVKNKPAYFNQGFVEIRTLEMLNNTYDPEDSHHLVRLCDYLVFRKHLCLVFEILSINLYELLKQNQYRGLSVNLMRVFVVQILDAMKVLQQANVIHCDLKPENILLENLSSPNIKLIDFGSACLERQTVYSYIQSRFYRSPEVLLGLRYTGAIDMWSLGCIAAELFLGLPLFAGSSEHNQLARIIEMRGMPPLVMLERGKNVHKFFNRRISPNPSTHGGLFVFELKSAEQYAHETRTERRPSKQYFKTNDLRELILGYPYKRSLNEQQRAAERAQRLAFLHFLQGVLEWQPEKRWTAQQAADHPFITGEPFSESWTPAAAKENSARAARSVTIGGGNTRAGSDEAAKSSTAVTSSLSSPPRKSKSRSNTVESDKQVRSNGKHEGASKATENASSSTGNRHISAISSSDDSLDAPLKRSASIPVPATNSKSSADATHGALRADASGSSVGLATLSQMSYPNRPSSPGLTPQQRSGVYFPHSQGLHDPGLIVTGSSAPGPSNSVLSPVKQREAQQAQEMPQQKTKPSSSISSSSTAAKDATISSNSNSNNNNNSNNSNNGITSNTDDPSQQYSPNSSSRSSKKFRRKARGNYSLDVSPKEFGADSLSSTASQASSRDPSEVMLFDFDDTTSDNNNDDGEQILSDVSKIHLK